MVTLFSAPLCRSSYPFRSREHAAEGIRLLRGIPLSLIGLLRGAARGRDNESYHCPSSHGYHCSAAARLTGADSSTSAANHEARSLEAPETRKDDGVTLKTTYYCDMDTPVGTLLLAGGEERLAAIYFQSGPHPKTVRAEWIASKRPFQNVVRQLSEYFAGRRRCFEVPLEPTGTPFQRAVWQELTQIPYGASTSYGEIARRIGHPLASRAVGRANGANPWPIVVPCHRVIGANRSLTGFGGGLAIKQRLLLLEAEADGPGLLSPPEGRVAEPSFSVAFR